jgi:hypothetical protein
VDRESLLKGMGAKADLPAPETNRLQSDYKNPSSKTPQGAFATAIEGRFHGKEQDKAQTGTQIDSEASRP